MTTYREQLAKNSELQSDANEAVGVLFNEANELAATVENQRREIQTLNFRLNATEILLNQCKNGASTGSGSTGGSGSTEKEIIYGPMGHSDTFWPKEDNFSLENKIVYGSGRTLLITSSSNRTFKNFRFNDVDFFGYDDVLAQNPEYLATYWGFRVREVDDWEFNRCTFNLFGHKRREGHAFYGDLKGSVLFNQCTFNKNQGQSIYCLRRNEVNTPSDSYRATGIIDIQECVFRHGGYGLDKGAGTITIYGSGPDQDVMINGCDFECNYSENDLPELSNWNGQTKWQSRGAITIRCVDGNSPEWWDMATNKFDSYDETLNRNSDGSWKGSDPIQGDVVVKDTKINHVDCDRAVCSHKGSKSLVYENVEITEGVLDIDNPQDDGPNTGAITIRNCKGGAHYRINGGPLRPLSTDFFRR